MVKLAFIIFSSIWLSCGNTPQTVENRTNVSEEESELITDEETDTFLSNDLTKDVAFVSGDQKEVDNEISNSKETLEKTNKSSKDISLTHENSLLEEKELILPNHKAWNTLLSKYVDTKGDVDYKAFKNDSEALNNYLIHLAENSPKKDWSKNEKLAYYINLYNAATVKLILDNYPVKSIKDIKNPWGIDWVKTGDGILSLGDIEHKVLRKMNEPRIHFAINCASFSCPKLLNKAFTASQMEKQLNAATHDFINDKTRNIISKEVMQLSNIFKWYKKDFTTNGSLADYIKPYTAIEVNNETDIDFLKYDWNLNETK